MNMLVMILIILAAMFAVMLLSACRAASLADEQMERMFRDLPKPSQKDKGMHGRFSSANKAWAQTVDIPADMSLDMDRRHTLVVNSHPAVLDGFVHMAREVVRKAKKEPIHEKLQKTSDQVCCSKARKRQETER